jgi:hypothetical protein
MGVVGPAFDPTITRIGPYGTPEGAHTRQGFFYDSDGVVYKNGQRGCWAVAEGDIGDLERFPQYEHAGPYIDPGDALGLLLDLDAGTLAVYINGDRVGIAVPGVNFPGRDGPYSPAQISENPGMFAPMKGPMRWCVDVLGGASLHINAPMEPPVVTEADRAEDARQQREFDERDARHAQDIYTSSESEEEDDED